MTPTETREIVWKLHLRAPPVRVFEHLATDAGRARFWAEETRQRETEIQFRFATGETLTSRVLRIDPPWTLELTYFDDTVVSFALLEAPGGGTDLELRERGVPEASWAENHAGWISVLMALKAAVDFGADLRNHDAARSWLHGFVDN